MAITTPKRFRKLTLGVFLFMSVCGSAQAEALSTTTSVPELVTEGREVLDTREFRDVLPDSFPNFRRAGIRGKRRNQTKGIYRDVGNARINIIIAEADPPAWLHTEIDLKTDAGFERTQPFRTGDDEYPSYEKFTREGDAGSCEIYVWVAERFVVSVEGRKVENEHCEEARDAIGYIDLADFR